MNNKILILLILVGLSAGASILQGKHLYSKTLVRDQHTYYRSSTRSSSSSSHNPILDMIFGFFLFIICFPVIWFNERRYLINQYRIKWAFDMCKDANSSEVNPNFEKQLICTSGNAKTNDVVSDNQFAVSEVNCIRLERIVEMFQWQESRRESDNRTYYEYNIGWHHTFIDSNNFHSPAGHENDRAKWIVQAQSYLAPNVYLGQYFLSDSLKKKTTNAVPLQLSQQNAQCGANNFNSGIHQSIVSAGEYIHFKQQNNVEFSGDIRISFEKYPCEDITVVSQQTNNTFEPYVLHDKYEQNESAENLSECQGCCSQMCSLIKKVESPMSEIDWLHEGIITKQQAFQEELDKNSCQTTVVRSLGWFLMGIGLCCIFAPITYVVSYFPLLGNFLASVSGFIFGLISFMIATPLALITIATAWIYYRPLVGLALFGVAIAIGAGIYGIISSQSQ